MRIHRGLAGALVASAVVLTASSPAWGSPEGSSDEGLGALAPDPYMPIVVRFDASAASLPEDAIRAAIERELERRPSDERLVAGELEIALEGEHVVMRFRSREGYTERLLPLPEDRSQVPLLLALVASNLARDQRLRERPESPPRAATKPTPRPTPTPKPSYKVHHLGLHVAQDILLVGGHNVCDPTRGDLNDNYACFYEGTKQPFFHTPDPNTDSVSNGAALATTRLLLSYELAPWPVFSFGMRIGYAFRGGPPAGMGPAEPVDPAGTVLYSVPADVQVSGGTAFIPLHIEMRASYWFAPLTNARVRGFIGAGFGLAQIDAKVKHPVIDCDAVAGAAAAADPSDTDGAQAYEACIQNGANPRGVPPTALDAWKKVGQGFAALHAGGTVTLVGDLAAELNLNVMTMFPARGFALEPSLGLVMGL